MSISPNWRMEYTCVNSTAISNNLCDYCPRNHPSHSTTSFQFVNISHPDQAISAKIRSPVMRNYLDWKESRLSREFRLRVSSEQNRAKSRATKMKHLK
jgi:hypothetical protein